MAATRQKGRDVGERTRRVVNSAVPSRDDKLNSSGHSSPLQVISEGEEKTWTCPKCTFINICKESDSDVLICGMCEMPTDPAEVEFDIVQAVAPRAISPIETHVVDEAKRDRLGSADSDQGICKRSQATPLDSRDRQNSTGSDTDTFRRSQSLGSLGGFSEDDEISVISDLAMDEMSEAARSAGGLRGSRNRLGGLGAALGVRKSQNHPAEQEKKGWFARLGSTVSNPEESDGFQRNQPSLKLKNIQVDPSICLLYTSPSPRDQRGSRMPSSA